MSADPVKTKLSDFDQSMIAYAERYDDERLLWKVQRIIDSEVEFKLTSGVRLSLWLIENKRFKAVQPLIDMLQAIHGHDESLEFFASTWISVCGEGDETLRMARMAAAKDRVIAKHNEDLPGYEQMSQRDLWFVNFVKNNGDECLIQKLSSDIGFGKFRTYAVVVVTVWLIDNDRFETALEVLRLLRSSGREHQVTDDMESCMLWSLGLRNSALTLARNGYQKWKDEVLHRLVRAMEDLALEFPLEDLCEAVPAGSRLRYEILCSRCGAFLN